MSGIEIDTNVIETGKTCAIDILYAVIRDQETLLPPHEHGPSVAVRDGVVRSFKVVLNVTEGGEAGPMYHVVGLVGAPVLSTEAVATANDFSVKVGGELGIIFGETSDAKVTAEERRRKVDVDDGYRDIIAIPSTLLCSLEGGTGVETVVSLGANS